MFFQYYDFCFQFLYFILHCSVALEHRVFVGVCTHEIEELEIPYRGIRSSYIPKQLLDKKNEISHIANGDIIALVTTIAGLDIAHVGFAYWKNGKLHILHASSGRGKVIKDQTTLFDYMKNRSKQPGIRVMRRINQK